MNTSFNIGGDEIRARVKAAPWSFFHLPVECWTSELALIAWRHIGFVLARVPSDFSPELYFEDGKWEQFLELLCESASIATLLTSGNSPCWRSIAHIIDDYLSSKDAIDTGEQLPQFSDLSNLAD